MPKPAPLQQRRNQMLLPRTKQMHTKTRMDNPTKMIIMTPKKFRNDPDWTPNNHDIYLDPTEIPKNIVKENYTNLTRRLQKLMPLDKTIHLNLVNGSTSREEQNNISISTSLRINGRKVKFE